MTQVPEKSCRTCGHKDVRHMTDICLYCNQHVPSEPKSYWQPKETTPEFKIEPSKFTFRDSHGKPTGPTPEQGERIEDKLLGFSEQEKREMIEDACNVLERGAIHTVPSDISNADLHVLVMDYRWWWEVDKKAWYKVTNLYTDIGIYNLCDYRVVRLNYFRGRRYTLCPPLKADEAKEEMT